MTITVRDWENPEKFVSRHATIGPLAHDRVFIACSGVIVIDLKGYDPDRWRYETLRVGIGPNQFIQKGLGDGWLPPPA
jgi:hypothetical protein